MIPSSAQIFSGQAVSGQVQFVYDSIFSGQVQFVYDSMFVATKAQRTKVIFNFI